MSDNRLGAAAAAAQAFARQASCNQREHQIFLEAQVRKQQLEKAEAVRAQDFVASDSSADAARHSTVVELSKGPSQDDVQHE